MDAKAKQILRKERTRIKLEYDLINEEINELSDKAWDLGQTLELLDRLIGEDKRIPKQAAHRVEHLSVIQLVERILKDSDKPMTLAEVTDALKEQGLTTINGSTVRTALVRLANGPIVDRVKRGYYQYSAQIRELHKTFS